MNRKGVYDVRSEWQNSRAAYWGPKTDRFRKGSNNGSPGPGAHDQYGELKKGNQAISNYHTIKTPSFGIGEKLKVLFPNKNPGPGSYRMPSDFGYVDAMD